MPKSLHSSMQTAHEYSGKAPEITSKMTSMWESKVQEEGGKLPVGFRKNIRDSATFTGGIPPRGPSLKMMGSRGSLNADDDWRKESQPNTQADPGPPVLAKKLSVVELKSAFENEVVTPVEVEENIVMAKQLFDQPEELSSELHDVLQELELQVKNFSESLDRLKNCLKC